MVASQGFAQTGNIHLEAPIFAANELIIMLLHLAPSAWKAPFEQIVMGDALREGKRILLSAECEELSESRARAECRVSRNRVLSVC